MRFLKSLTPRQGNWGDLFWPSELNRLAASPRIANCQHTADEIVRFAAKLEGSISSMNPWMFRQASISWARVLPSSNSSAIERPRGFEHHLRSKGIRLDTTAADEFDSLS